MAEVLQLPQRDLIQPAACPAVNLLSTLESEEPVGIPPPADESEELGPSPALRADTVAESVLILLALTGVQRIVGFCRAVLFCRWLPSDELGQWDMAFSFLMLAAPLAMIALPSCFGRYLEHYRQRGHLRTLVRRTAVAVAGLALAAGLAIFLGRTWFSTLIFASPRHTTLVAILAGCLVIVVSTHYLIELLLALRSVRLLAVIQLVNSVAFALFGGALVLGWSSSAASVVVAYAAACLVSTVLALWQMAPLWRSVPRPAEPLDQRDFWAKILPYVAWVSLTSLMANLFEIADRYMILHYAPGGPDVSLALVGQYHSSRIVPLLLVSVSLLLGSMMTPHLAHDWELGRRDQVRFRLNLFLKLLAFALSAAAAAVLLAAPLLFDWALAGKFVAGRDVLPLTLVYCIWFALTLVSQNYLLCAERARLASAALVVGLVVNVVLNRLLLPVFGLPGAVLATAAANLAALVLLAAFNHALGFRPDRATLGMMALPALLVLDCWVAPAVLALVGLLALVSPRVLSLEERAQLADVWRRFTTRLR